MQTVDLFNVEGKTAFVTGEGARLGHYHSTKFSYLGVHMRDCPVCNESTKFVSNGNITEVTCGRCGQHNVKHTAVPLLLNPSNLKSRQKANLSG